MLSAVRALNRTGLEHQADSITRNLIACTGRQFHVLIGFFNAGTLNEWRTEDIDPSAEFRAHFEGGNPNADVPDLVGLGLMSDGDQTLSASAADYAAFQLVQ